MVDEPPFPEPVHVVILPVAEQLPSMDAVPEAATVLPINAKESQLAVPKSPELASIQAMFFPVASLIKQAELDADEESSPQETRARPAKTEANASIFFMISPSVFIFKGLPRDMVNREYQNGNGGCKNFS